MHEFMLLFRFEPTDQEPSPEELQQMEVHWGSFIQSIAEAGKLVSTHQLGFTGKIVSTDGKSVNGFVVADSQVVAGNMVLKANSLEEATEWAEKCPILFMGGTVEVRNVIPMN